MCVKTFSKLIILKFIILGTLWPYYYITSKDIPLLYRFLNNTNNLWDMNIQVYEDIEYDYFFTRYSKGWTGADGTYSINIGNISCPKIMWFFGDTLYGNVFPNRTRSLPLRMLRNTMVIQNKNSFESFISYPNYTSFDNAYFKASNQDEWYWPGSAIAVGSYPYKYIRVFLFHLKFSGFNAFDGIFLGMDMAIIDLSDMNVINITNFYIGDITYGSTVLEENDYLYIYGISTYPPYLEKSVHVSRINKYTFSQLEEWNGVKWCSNISKNGTQAYSIFSSAAEQFRVFKSHSNANKYYLVSQEIVFSPKIFIVESLFPTGPFYNKRILYATPYSFEKDRIMTYNSYVHIDSPKKIDKDELFISYNIASLNSTNNADLYRPRFIRVLNWTT